MALGDNDMLNSFKIVLDVENGIERLGGNKSLYIHLLKKFNENLIKDFPRFEKALSENAIKDIHGEIHTLKGVAGNLSATALYEGCSALDASLKSGLQVQVLYCDVLRIYQETQIEVQRLLKDFM